MEKQQWQVLNCQYIQFFVESVAIELETNPACVGLVSNLEYVEYV